MLKCPNCGDSNSFEILCSAFAWVNQNEDVIELHKQYFKYEELVECNECGYRDRYDKFKVKEKK